jgi:hypothetical protein
MNRCIVAFLITAGMMGASGAARAQEQSEKQVSGPEQMNPKKSTGKSYKKGTKKPSAKEKNPSTGQNRRLGNTGDLTKNGDDVNGKRGEKSSQRKSDSEASQQRQ